MATSGEAPSPERQSKAIYSAAMANRVIEDLAAGKTYQKVTSTTEGRPCIGTLYRWRCAHPEFADAADAARAFGAEVCADRALDVAQAATDETLRTAKLKIDTLMQRANALAPERWGGRSPRVAKAEPVEMVFRVRRFEKVAGTDGRTVLREILPENEA